MDNKDKEIEELKKRLQQAELLIKNLSLKAGEKSLPDKIADWPGAWRVMLERMAIYFRTTFNVSMKEASETAIHVLRELYEDRA